VRLLRPRKRTDTFGVSALFAEAEADSKFRRTIAIRQAENRARTLYREISQELGHQEALRIFANWREPSQKEVDAINNFTLLMLYESCGRPPKSTFARRVVEINKGLSRDLRYGPRGSCSVETIRKQLSRLLKKRPRLSSR
jgi:hypothetical protein